MGKIGLTPKQRISKGMTSTQRVTFGGCDVFLVGSGSRWHHWTSRSSSQSYCLLKTNDDVLKGFECSPKDSIWVALGADTLAILAREAIQSSGNRRLVVLQSVQEVTHHVLNTWFRHVVAGKDGISLLQTVELLEVLFAPNRNELLIGGAFDRIEKVFLLYRGSVEPLVVPLDWFRERAGGPKADPDGFGVIDYGQTVKLGDYEAATDAILYEFDDEYRARAKKRLIQEDESLGGSIRRLRIQRGLSRTDFSPIPIRTIARIEHGEVRKPRKDTLERIALRLQVPVDELATY